MTLIGMYEYRKAIKDMEAWRIEELQNQRHAGRQRSRDRTTVGNGNLRLRQVVPENRVSLGLVYRTFQSYQPGATMMRSSLSTQNQKGRLPKVLGRSGASVGIFFCGHRMLFLQMSHEALVENFRLLISPS